MDCDDEDQSIPEDRIGKNNDPVDTSYISVASGCYLICITFSLLWGLLSFVNEKSHMHDLISELSNTLLAGSALTFASNLEKLSNHLLC